MVSLASRVLWGVLLLSTCSTTGCGRSSEAGPSADGTISPVGRGDLMRTVGCTGRIVSNLDVDIKCRASGEVIKLPFDISDSVKKGQLLLELDPSDQSRDVKRAQAAVAQSRAKLDQARQNLKVARSDLDIARKRAAATVQSARIKLQAAQAKTLRRRNLVKQRLCPQEDLETSEVETAAAAAELQTALVQADEAEARQLTVELRGFDTELAQAQQNADQIALEITEQQLAYTRVVAPLDGVVASRNIQIGTIISSGITNVGGGTTVLTLSDVSRLFVLASVDEANIGQVRLGQRAVITADSCPGQKFEGRVDRIAAKGVNISNVVTFEVKVEVTGSNRHLLKPEMTANVKFVCDERRQVLCVPIQATTRKGDRVTVRVARQDGEPVERPVTLGLSDDESVEVVSGLSAGENVVVPKEPPSRWSSSQQGGMPPPPPPM